MIKTELKFSSLENVTHCKQVAVLLAVPRPGLIHLTLSTQRQILREKLPVFLSWTL